MSELIEPHLTSYQVNLIDYKFEQILINYKFELSMNTKSMAKFKFNSLAQMLTDENFSDDNITNKIIYGAYSMRAQYVNNVHYLTI